MKRLVLGAILLMLFFSLKAQSPKEVFYHYEHFIFFDTAYIPKVTKAGDFVKLTFKEDTLNRLAAKYQFKYFYTRDSLKLKKIGNYNVRMYLLNIYYNLCVNDTSFISQWKKILHHKTGNPKPFYDKTPYPIPRITSDKKHEMNIWLEEPWPSDSVKGYFINFVTLRNNYGFIYTHHDTVKNTILIGDLISTSKNQILIVSKAGARVHIKKHKPIEDYTLYYKGDTLQFRVAINDKKFTVDVLKRVGHHLHLQNAQYDRLQKRDVLIGMPYHWDGVYDTLLLSKIPSIVRKYNLQYIHDFDTRNDKPYYNLRGIGGHSNHYFIYKRPLFFSKRRLRKLETKLKSMTKKEGVFLGWYPKYFSRY